MLILSREARIRIANHSWNVESFEANGILLGDADNKEILAALPCSKTSRSEICNDRWNGVAEALALADSTAKHFGLSVVGLYGSEDAMVESYPKFTPPDFIKLTTMRILLVYHIFCCKGHSSISLFQDGRQLVWQSDYFEPKGKRIRNDINQKKVHALWVKNFGQIDYSND